MDYEIKRLQKADLSLFKKLLEVFSNAFDDDGQNEEGVTNDEYLIALLERNDFYALAAFQGNEVLGGLTGYEFVLATKNTKEMYLYDLAVNGNHRMKGIASALISALKVHAKENNISVIFVEAESKDEGAVMFYKSLGLDATPVQHFNIIVD